MNKLKELFSSKQGNSVLAALVLFLVLMLNNTARGFVYDASHYWSGAYAFLLGSDPLDAGWLQVRGIYSSIIYLPAVLSTNVLGQQYAGYFVLVQNSMLIATLGAFILPSYLRKFQIRSKVSVWISAFITGICLFGFAPYPLMDLWATALFLISILFLISTVKFSTLISGLLFAVAVNIRPAYLVPTVAVLAVWAIWNSRKILFVFIGLFIALLPQTVFNLVNGLGYLPWPKDSFSIAATQSTFASFIVRYDTVPFDANRGAAQFYCSPMMSELLHGDAPTTTVGVLNTFFHNLPEAAIFIIQKWSAMFFWSSETPYLAPSMHRLNVLGIFVVAIVALGFVGHFVYFRKTFPGIQNKLQILISVAVLSIMGTIALSTPEARFSLPLICFAILGCILFGSIFFNAEITPPQVFKLAGATVSLGLVIAIAGFTGLKYPAPPGLVSPEICLETKMTS